MDPGRLVFLDETATTTNMARRYGRCPASLRLVAAAPHGHCHTTTFAAGLRLGGVTAPLVLDGPVTGAAFLAYVEQALAPRLHPGDAVVLVPEARVAWTGNLVLGTGVLFLIEGGAETYLRTIERFADALDVETIVPGHGPIVKPEVLGAYRRYLGDLVSAMAVSPPGESVESALSRFPLAPAYLPPGIDEPTRAFIEGLHVFNVWRVLEERRPGVAAGGAR